MTQCLFKWSIYLSASGDSGRARRPNGSVDWERCPNGLCCLGPKIGGAVASLSRWSAHLWKKYFKTLWGISSSGSSASWFIHRSTWLSMKACSSRINCSPDIFPQAKFLAPYILIAKPHKPRRRIKNFTPLTRLIRAELGHRFRVWIKIRHSLSERASFGPNSAFESKFVMMTP